jgi:hypothetical protein
MPVEQHDCAATVWSGGRSILGYRCQNNAKFFEEDRWWCHLHAPSKIQAKREKRRSESRAADEARQAKADRAYAMADQLTEKLGVKITAYNAIYGGWLLVVSEPQAVLDRP